MSATDITNGNENSITNLEAYGRYFDIEMFYQKSNNFRLRGKQKLEFALLFAARIGFVSPLVCAEVWETPRHKTLAFLNKMVSDGLLLSASTSRINDGRIYVLTYAGANYAKEIMRVDFPFRSSSEPIHQVNQNSIMHDAILSYIIAAGIQNCDANSNHKPLWKAVVTETEFKRLYPSNEVKNVDAVVLLNNDKVAAVEIEHSYKRKQQHEASILKFKSAMFSTNLYDQVFLVVASNKIHTDTKRFYEQLLEEMPNRINKKTKQPMLTVAEAEYLKENIIFRTKFIEDINRIFYK
ncbi:hypothetical protein [Glaciecola sp. 1036]|uniref:hypothetical protein n=1 Tax=Alteromonadaceae TaxID=72275 RepID=UPI003D083B8F